MMNKRKPVMLIVLLVLLVAALSGCSKSGNEGKKGKEGEVIPCGNIRGDIVKVSPCSEPFPYCDMSVIEYGILKDQLEYLKEFNSSEERNVKSAFIFGSGRGDGVGISVRFVETSDGFNAEYLRFCVTKVNPRPASSNPIYVFGDETADWGWTRRCIYNIDYRTGNCKIMLSENGGDGKVTVLEQKMINMDVEGIKYFADQLHRIDTSVVRAIDDSFLLEVDLKDLLRYFYPLDETAFKIDSVYKAFCNDCHQLSNRAVTMGSYAHIDNKPMVDICGAEYGATYRTGNESYGGFNLYIMESTQEDFDALLIKD